MEDIDNTNAAWGEKLLALAAESAGDAAQRDSGLVLSQTLDDLARVLTSYAARLGVEPQPVASEPVAEEPQDAETNQAEAQEALAPLREVGFTDLLMGGALPAPDTSALEARIAALESRPEPAAFDLPGWIRETLQNHHEAIVALGVRVATLEDAHAAALLRIEWLENNIALGTVAVTESYAPEPPQDPDDYNPDAWGSIERARTALSNQVQREHRRLAGLRQTVLNAVVALTDAPDLTDDDKAQLAQHRARAERLDQIDVVRDAKLDEIAGLDDLQAAKTYQAFNGWPR